MYVTASPEKPTLEADTGFSLPHLVRLARRHFRMMAVIFLVIVAAAAAITLKMRPVYSADVHLMIDKPGEQLIQKDDNQSNNNNTVLDSGSVESEVQVLRSPALAESVVRDLRLDQDPEFNPALRPPGLMASLLAALPLHVQHPASRAAGKPLNPVVDATMSRLKVSRVGASYMIEATFTSEDPQKAARIANAFAQNFLQMQLDAKFDIARQANTWLDNHIGELRQRVLNADAALQNYKIQNNLLSAQGETLTEQEISNLDQQAALTRASQAEAQARYDTAMRQLAHGSAGDDVGETLSSPVIQQLRQQHATISARIANLESRYGPRHPDLLKAQGELAAVDSQTKVEISRILSNLQAQATVAKERADSMGSSVSEARAGLAATNRSLVRLNELQRDADAERAVYETFLSKFKEISAEASLARTDAHVVSPARPPSAPSAPNKSLNLVFGAALGLAAAVTAALVADIFETGLGDADVVERELSLPYLGSIPSLSSVAAADDPLKRKPIDHLVVKPMSSFAESFRSLKAAIEFSRMGARAKVLAVTSSLSGEGKTTTSVGLARSAAIAGIRVVVVDCDLRQRAVNQLLELSPTVGLMEVLNGAATLDEALMVDELSGAMVLPLAQPEFTPKDVFNSDAMAELVEELKRRFDLVVLDTAPVILVTDTRSVARLADAVLLLVLWRKTSRSLAHTSVRLLTTAGANMAGVALTRVDLRQNSGLAPGDPSSYYNNHKRYYLT